eukprot:bmy_20355T0
MALFTPWKLSSQKLGFFLVTFGFIWGMMLLHFTIQQRTQPESSSMLREQILDLSKRYIKALAEENRNVVDGPYAGVMTAYAPCLLLASLEQQVNLLCGPAVRALLWTGAGGKHGHGREGFAFGTSTDKLPEHLFGDFVDFTLYQRTPGMIEMKASFPQRDILNVFTYFDLIFIMYSLAVKYKDLKKTLAVLLDNILQRIGKLESKVDNLEIHSLK